MINDPNSLLLICLNRGASPTLANFLGSLFISAIKNSIFRRKPNDTRYPMTHLFCDEFQSFMSATTGSVLLSESRKYRIDVRLSCQFSSQIENQRFREEILQNTSLQCFFNLDLKEANSLGKKIDPQDGGQALNTLPLYHCFIFDKVLQQHARFVTRPLDEIDVKPVYSNARPINIVRWELQQREELQKQKYRSKGKEELDLFRSKFKKRSEL